MNIFVTADTHFGHENIIKFCPGSRPFGDAATMDREIIARWNDRVKSDDVVYHLGDFAFSKPARVLEILSQLHGRIRLITGNHDSWLFERDGLTVRSRHQPIVDLFDWVRPLAYHQIKGPDDRRIVMCHFPFDTWDQSHRGSWHLHGHTHAGLEAGGRLRLDVGVDSHPDCAPFSYQEICDRLQPLTDRLFTPTRE